MFDSCFILNGYGCASFVVAKEYDTVKVFELCSSFEISKLRARTATGQFTYNITIRSQNFRALTTILLDSEFKT